MADFLFFQLLLWLVPLGFGAAAIYLGVRFIRAFERRGSERGELQALHARVEQLEQDLTRATDGIERLEESQRFTQRLLAERSGNGPTAT